MKQYQREIVYLLLILAAILLVGLIEQRGIL